MRTAMMAMTTSSSMRVKAGRAGGRRRSGVWRMGHLGSESDRAGAECVPSPRSVGAGYGEERRYNDTDRFAEAPVFARGNHDLRGIYTGTQSSGIALIPGVVPR